MFEFALSEFGIGHGEPTKYGQAQASQALRSHSVNGITATGWIGAQPSASASMNQMRGMIAAAIISGANPILVASS
jgi:hypothetical protein